jgi:parallel beta-helix repeat protein
MNGSTKSEGIHLNNSKNSKITNNVVQNNGKGVVLDSDTSGIGVSSNIISQNNSGNIMDNGSENTIINNNISAPLQPIPNPI